jgi:outer membrane protein assembly factor BamB
VDSKVQAFDVSTGARRWIYSATQSVLTLRGNSAPVIQGGIVYVAFDNGKTTAIDLRTGLPRWEQRFVIPDGRSELERVIDVQADPLVTGSSVFIGAYQGALVELDNDTGSIQWQEKASVSRSMALLDDHSALAYVEDGDIVRVLSLNGGGQIWQADLFDNRRLTSPAIAGGIVAVADQQGYIHLLDADSGQYAGRYNLSSSGVRMDLVGVGQVLYVLANDGYLYAFDVSR